MHVLVAAVFSPKIGTKGGFRIDTLEAHKPVATLVPSLRIGARFFFFFPRYRVKLSRRKHTAERNISVHQQCSRIEPACEVQVEQGTQFLYNGCRIAVVPQKEDTRELAV